MTTELRKAAEAAMRRYESLYGTGYVQAAKSAVALEYRALAAALAAPPAVDPRDAVDWNEVDRLDKDPATWAVFDKPTGNAQGSIPDPRDAEITRLREAVRVLGLYAKARQSQDETKRRGENRDSWTSKMYESYPFECEAAMMDIDDALKAVIANPVARAAVEKEDTRE